MKNKQRNIFNYSKKIIYKFLLNNILLQSIKSDENDMLVYQRVNHFQITYMTWGFIFLPLSIILKIIAYELNIINIKYLFIFDFVILPIIYLILSITINNLYFNLFAIKYAKLYDIKPSSPRIYFSTIMAIIIALIIIIAKII